MTQLAKPLAELEEFEAMEQLKERQEVRKAEQLRNIGSLIKGQVRRNEPFSIHTSFRIGGPAEVWVEPEDMEDLKKIVCLCREEKIDLFVIGAGTNIIVEDSGRKGITVSLAAPAFKTLNIEGETVNVGAGVKISEFLKALAEAELSGYEFLSGIPGSIGGALAVNAGGGGRSISENLLEVRVIDREGNIKTIKKEEIDFSYRYSTLSRYIIWEAKLALKKGSREDITFSLSRCLEHKRRTQELTTPSAGCIFKNIPDAEMTSGELIERAGIKGVRLGGARVSERHANFIINVGGAKAKDVLGLINLIKHKIKEEFKVALELEVKVIK